MGKRFSNTACRFGIVSVGCKFILHISIARKSSHYDAVFQRRVQHKHITWLTYSSSVFRPRDWTDAAVNQKVLHEPFTTPSVESSPPFPPNANPAFSFSLPSQNSVYVLEYFYSPFTALIRAWWKKNEKIKWKYARSSCVRCLEGCCRVNWWKIQFQSKRFLNHFK